MRDDQFLSFSDEPCQYPGREPHLGDLLGPGSVVACPLEGIPA